MQVGEEERAGRLLQLLEVLDRRLHRVALEEDAALEVAEAVARRARCMADHRARLVDRPLPPGATSLERFSHELWGSAFDEERNRYAS